jgi:hypothetical protein
MKKIIIFYIIFLQVLNLFSQFSPPAGQIGSTAIYKDSSIIIGWATHCQIYRGYQDISDQSLGLVTIGDSSMVLGKAGENGVVSLGDGGSAIISFLNPIKDGPGWDFAVFENGFSDTFLELAFVEVSSDGINFYRFPATSLTQDSVQVDGFGGLDATKIDNLAGKFKANYGTPFDLNQLKNIQGLDLNSVSHIRIIDVIGCITEEYATYDIHGHKINDPWNTPYASGGFDLDAVGVINSATSSQFYMNYDKFSVYPIPANDYLIVELESQEEFVYTLNIFSPSGEQVESKLGNTYNSFEIIDVSEFPNGLYFMKITGENLNFIKKIIVNHE